MASLARSLSYLSNLSRLYNGTTSAASTDIMHAMPSYPQHSAAQSMRSMGGQSESLWRRGTHWGLPMSPSRNPSSLATLSEHHTLDTDDTRNRAPISFSSDRGRTSDYLSGTLASSGHSSLVSDQSHDDTSALSLLVDAKRAKQTARDLAVLQNCLERMAVGGPTNDADLSQTLLELAQKPHMCDLIPGLNQFRRPLDVNFNAAAGGKRNSDLKGRGSAMDAKRLKRLHLPKRKGYYSSSLSPAGSNVSSTASDAHSPTKPTSPIQPEKQHLRVSDPEYGENLPNDGEDDDDNDDGVDD